MLGKNVPEKWVPLPPFNSRVIDTKNTPVAIIDIDTTGLPRSPREKKGIIIKTDGFPVEAVEFHGITLERSQSEGVPFITAAKQMLIRRA